MWIGTDLIATLMKTELCHDVIYDTVVDRLETLMKTELCHDCHM